MSDSTTSGDPARDDDANFEPIRDEDNSDFPADSAPVRTGGLSAICVLAIVFSALGLLMGCIGLPSLIFPERMQAAMSPPQVGGNAQLVEIQQEMNAKALEINSKYRWISLPLMIGKIAIEFALLAGAIMSWGLKPRGRSWLLYAIVAALVLESLQMIPTIMIQRETFALMGEYMPKMMAAQPGAQNMPSGMGDAMATGASVAGIFSMVFAIAWLLMKIVYYAISIGYLRKPAVVALFSESAN
jgi:hypothetical protein